MFLNILIFFYEISNFCYIYLVEIVSGRLIKLFVLINVYCFVLKIIFCYNFKILNND